MELSIDKIRIGQRTRKNNGDIAALAKSISDIGLLHPIVIDPDYNLIAGQRRVEAHKHLGRSTIEARIVDNLRDAYELIKAERDENVCRMDFTPTEAVAMAEVLEPLERAAAAARMTAGVSQSTEPCGNLPQGSTGKSRDKVAASVGMSERTLKKAEEVVKAAEAQPSLFGDLPDKMDETGKVDGAYKEMKTRQAQKEYTEQTKSDIKITPKVEVCDCITWLSKTDGCDLLLTDPPYSTDVDNIYDFSEWLPVALNKVKSTGRAYVFIGSYPQELNAYLSLVPPSHIELVQMLIWTYKNTLGNNPKDRYKQNYQVCLYFKGIDALKLNCPLTSEQWAVINQNAPDGRQGDRYHTWQKPLPLAEMLVRHSTNPGDIVFDPFTCTGTFLIAAGKLGRFGYGCDISSENLTKAIGRGCEYFKF